MPKKPYQVDEERKRNSLLIEGKFVPLIKITDRSLNPIRHMIKPADLDFLSEVYQFLTVLPQSEVYLSGGAPANWVFKGFRMYKDVDLIVAAQEGDMAKGFKDMLEKIRLADKYAHPMRLVEGRYAYAKENTRKGSYVNIFTEDPMKCGPSFNFFKIPTRDEIEIGSFSKVSPIDVNFFLNSGFEEYIMRLQGK